MIAQQKLNYPEDRSGERLDCFLAESFPDLSRSQIQKLISSQQIQLNGGVIIDQARGSMRGESIRYDLKTGRLSGGGNGGRVQMRLNPASGAGN